MSEKIFNQLICLKEYITQKEYNEISELENICNSEDKTNLKLELDYKLNMYNEHNSGKLGLKNTNEFLYYVDETLVAYLGISSFGKNIGEINGMTHPKWRRKGLFKKLFDIAIDECNRRKFYKVLLLTDGKSNSGSEFIKAVGGKYDFSEYGMKHNEKITIKDINSVHLRKAEKADIKEIGRQDVIYFDDGEELKSFPIEDDITSMMNNEEEITDLFNEETRINTAYMVEFNEEVIGKMHIEYNDNSAFIFGFGILPQFRGKGYGKAALMQALSLINEKNIYEIELDVECKNDRALNLYKACGFEDISVMNYYNYNSK